MRSLTTGFVLLVLGFVLPAPLAHAQDEKPADNGVKSAPTGATKEEVEQLRREVAELRATIQRLILVNQPAPGAPRLVQVSAVQPENTAQPAETVQAAKQPAPKQPAPKKEGEAGLLAGWNGEHFFLKSADGQFQFQPYGYFQTDYRAYAEGDGVPPNTFTLRRVRFGFQGNYGKHYSFALLADTAGTSGAILRDIFLNIKVHPELEIQVGQQKEPFAQEELTGASNLDFVERSLASLLYPSASTAFRSPGAVVTGGLFGGRVNYWAGAFNGKGIATANTTSEPEVIGRLRFYPWKKTKGLFQGLAFGGAIGHGRARGLSNELSFNGALPEGTFAFFPSFAINGPVERYNGEFTWIKGPWAVRAEYDQLNQFRRGLSSIAGGVGQNDLSGVVAKAYYAQATYLLTGEKRPENGAVKPKSPFLTTEGQHGIGAWELKFRYSKIQAKTLNTLFSTGVVPGAEAHTDQFTAGVNWYPTYFVRYMLDFNVERAKDPTTANVLPQTFFVVLQRLQFRF